LPRWDFAVNLRCSPCRALMSSKCGFVPVFVGLLLFEGCSALKMKQRSEQNAKNLAEGKEVTQCVQSRLLRDALTPKAPKTSNATEHCCSRPCRRQHGHFDIVHDSRRLHECGLTILAFGDWPDDAQSLLKKQIDDESCLCHFDSAPLLKNHSNNLKCHVVLPLLHHSYGSFVFAFGTRGFPSAPDTANRQRNTRPVQRLLRTMMSIH
jgi:hypothetical protein